MILCYYLMCTLNSYKRSFFMAIGIIVILIVCTAPYFYRMHQRLHKLEKEVEKMKNNNL